MARKPDQDASDYLSPAGWIRAATSAHPAFKFAIVVGGLAALVSVVLRFGVSPLTLVFGIITLIVLMVLFLVFAQAARLKHNKLSLASLILVWTFLSICIATAVLLFTSTFFDGPLPIKANIVRALGPTITPDIAARSTAIPNSKATPTSDNPRLRTNALPDGKFETGEMFAGVKDVIHFPVADGGKEKIPFAILGLEKPAELLFAKIPPNYPFALATRFPDYKRTAYLDIISACPEAFDEDQWLKEGWRVQATVYDIDNDGIPELLVAINLWANDFWDSEIRLLVYTFHAPTNVADLSRSENWRLAGKASGQFHVLLNEDRVILPIGSRGGNLFLLKDDQLIDAGAVVTDGDGRYVPDH
ncbi:MAG TPA: hypothetical protein VGQ95_05830 [Chthoniobacterales bacterium]|nr:hypothetical protein [Chthoniobacterales bacterium]